ncbi:MAG: hypothetical protein HY862_04790 [Chloroflexi bacterium]|nr:hypothetical protein [Chloroflexota bacterium]
MSLDVGQKNGFYDHFQQRQTIELLCETLKCRALMTTEELDPNVFLEISGIGKSREVYVDPEKRKQGIYVIREYL